MSRAQSPAQGAALGSLGLFCGSSMGRRPAWSEAAAELGALLAAEGVRLVYGGGAVGLMGACAKAVVGGGGRVLGVIPDFLRLPEVAYEAAELVVVPSMHERKARMFAEADAFAVLPGGVGTLEEVIEILSWARLGLHSKPVVFVDIDGFWRPFFALIEHTIKQGLTPPEFAQAYGSVRSAREVLPAVRNLLAEARARPPMPLTVT